MAQLEGRCVDIRIAGLTTPVHPSARHHFMENDPGAPTLMIKVPTF